MADVEYLTDLDIARRLGIKPATVRDWRRRGMIPAVRISHKIIRYVWEDVVAAIGKRADSGVVDGQ